VMAKAPKPVLEQRVARAAEILGLGQLLERYPRQLSGGQRQRVAMGRAIVRDPQVFLFDEPLSNLDAKLRVQMRAEIKELHQRLGTTIVYVTHDQIEAMTMADKIVVMNGGKIEQIGEPLALYDRPANVFVAGFIGSPSMNFLRGRVESGRFNAGQNITLNLPDSATASEGQPALYGIRPEHMVLSGEGGIPAIVHVVEPTGSETQVVAQLGDASILCAFRERVSAKPGETIWIAPEPALAHIFDAETGRRQYAGSA
jgi:multiple sugar transport system ATP-binding protein